MKRRVINLLDNTITSVDLTPEEISAREEDANRSISSISIAKQNKSVRKQVILGKLGLNKNDIKGLLELIKDGDDE
jgi:hypothetical protein